MNHDHRTDAAVEEAWKFWEPLVAKDGQLDLEQVKKELADWHYVMQQVPKVHMAVTGEQLSKVMVPAETVIAAFEGYLTTFVEEQIQERLENIREIVEEQADDDSLWSIPLTTQRHMVEAHLQEALRRLHEAVECI